MFQRSKQPGFGFFAQSAQPCINHIALPMVNIATIGPANCHFLGEHFVRRVGIADCMRLPINKKGVVIPFLASGRNDPQVFREKIASLRSESA